MIYLPCVVRGQLDPVFTFKDEHKSEQEHINILKCSFSGLCTILFMRTITRHAIHVGALENYTKSNNITKLLAEL